MSFDSADIARWEARAIAFGERLAGNDALRASLERSQEASRNAVGGTGGTNSSVALLASLNDDPFEFSRAFQDE
ncbi:hypothetical protein CDL60_10380 [Roseateles noduli]|nr:hypothetical protein CDL60_10380 [Roseateles noduli]